MMLVDAQRNLSGIQHLKIARFRLRMAEKLSEDQTQFVNGSVTLNGSILCTVVCGSGLKLEAGRYCSMRIRFYRNGFGCTFQLN